MSDEILFRASGIGSLLVEGRGTVLTENQLIALNDFDLLFVRLT